MKTQLPVKSRRLEVITFVVVCGLLMGLFTYRLSARSEEKHIHRAKSELHAIERSLSDFKNRFFHYPSTKDGLEKLVQLGHLKHSAIVDPWGRPYTYLAPRTGDRGRFLLCSDGPDRENGSSDDICNFSRRRKL